MNRKEKAAAIAQVRDLQGKTANPWSVLSVLLIWQGPMTKKLLSELLDSSYNTIGQIVNRLEFEERIVRLDYRHWALPNGQLSLPGLNFSILVAPHKQISPVSSVAPHRRLKAGDRDDVCTDGVKNCVQTPPVNVQGDSDRVLAPDDRPPPTETSISRFETSNFDVSPTTTTTGSKRRDAVVGSRVGAETSNFDVSANLALAFQEAGIGRNMWPKLARLPHVTPDYVRAHTARRRADPDPRRRTVGLQIKKMRDGDPAPEWCAECGELDGGHSADCPQNYGRYTSGKYADLVEY